MKDEPEEKEADMLGRRWCEARGGSPMAGEGFGA